MKIVPLGKFIPLLSRSWVEPVHLASFTSQLERAIVEPVRQACSVCPRVGKTEAVLHAIPWWLLQRPDLRITYVSYSQRFSERRSRRARALAEQAGVKLDPSAQSRADWRVAGGDGGLWATSVEGSVTGEGFDVIVVDDPHKDRAASESAAECERIDEWFRDTLFTRLEPGGSVFVIHARWTPNDLIGRLERDGWPTLNIAAITETGESIWPERWPLSRLREIEETLGAYGWNSLYMGCPMARGGRPFEGVEFFDAMPENFEAITNGVDFAYTAKTSADASVNVTLGWSAGRAYVLDVVRQQVAAPDFRRALLAIATRFPGAGFHSYIGGTERAVVDFLEEDGVQINARPAIGDKFVRAQPASAAWCAKKILVPRSIAALRRKDDPEPRPEHFERRPPWLDAFVSEVCAFTGVNDRRDDQVDALVAAFDAAKREASEANDPDRGRAFVALPPQDRSWGFRAAERGEAQRTDRFLLEAKRARARANGWLID